MGVHGKTVLRDENVEGPPERGSGRETIGVNNPDADGTRKQPRGCFRRCLTPGTDWGYAPPRHALPERRKEKASCDCPGTTLRRRVKTAAACARRRPFPGPILSLPPARILIRSYPYCSILWSHVTSPSAFRFPTFLRLRWAAGVRGLLCAGRTGPPSGPPDESRHEP